VWLVKATFDGRDLRIEPVLADAPQSEWSTTSLVIDQHGFPVAWLDGQPSVDDVRELCEAVAGTTDADTEGPPLVPSPDPTISIVICTVGTRGSLGAAVQSAYLAARGRAELVIVVNSADREVERDVQRVIAELGVKARVILEPRKGLSRARNTGLRATETDVVAFTDDDVIVDDNWLEGVLRGFRRGSDVVAVTGLIPAAEIRTEAQELFERNGARWSTGLAPEVYRMSERRRYEILIPYSPHIGAGANLSVNRSSVLQAGGFDEALGAGTGTGGGEDLEILARLLRRGGAVAYEPSAIIWHLHRATKSSLYRQQLMYSIGTSAFLTRTALEPGRLEMLQSVREGARQYFRSSGSKADDGVPKSILAMNLFGMLIGPAFYGRERFRIVLQGHASRRRKPE
jgi:GT2 family glycosyltransferase